MMKDTKKKGIDKKTESAYPLTLLSITGTKHVGYDTSKESWNKIAPVLIENPVKGDILRLMKKIQPQQLYEPISKKITNNIPNWKECIEAKLYLRIVSSPPHLQFWKTDITRSNNCKLEFIVTSLESSKFIKNYEETQKNTPVNKLMFVGTPIFVYGKDENDRYLDWDKKGDNDTLTNESCVFFISTNNNESCQKILSDLKKIQSKIEPFIEGVESKQKLDTIHSYSLPIDITEKDWVNESNVYPKSESEDKMDLLWNPGRVNKSSVISHYESLIESKYTKDVDGRGSEDELLQSNEEISLKYLFNLGEKQKEQIEQIEQIEQKGEEQQDQKPDGSHLQLFQETDYPYGLVDLYNYWMYQNLLPVPGNQYSYRDIIDMSVYGEFSDDNSERVIVAPFINSPGYIFDRFTKQSFYKFIYTNNIADNVVKYKKVYNNFMKKNKKVLEEHLVKNIISKNPKFYWIYDNDKCVPFTINDLGSTHGSHKKLQDKMLLMKGHKKMTKKKKPYKI